MKKILGTVPVLILIAVCFSVNAEQETDRSAEQAAEQNTEVAAEQKAEPAAEQTGKEQTVEVPEPAAGKVIIATWNMNDMLTHSEVTRRKDSLKAFAEKVRPDILCVQEVVSYGILKNIAVTMGFKDYHVACSDFFQSDGAHRGAFEVGVISKYPFGQVIEYDPSPDNKNKEGEPIESVIRPMLKLGVKKVECKRGYLWVSIPAVRLTISVVHLKSSFGRTARADSINAAKREFVTGAVALGVIEDVHFFPGYSYVVAGDFNVGHSDASKNGSDLKSDCYADCGGADLYDDTHAILYAGIAGGLSMTNLTGHITESTTSTISGSPVDNIYVYGGYEDHFTGARKINKTYGSDHVPVWTVYSVP